MMIDFLLAWRNVWRNPRRSFLTLSAIAFACILLVFMLSFQLGSYESMINASVRLSTGHLQIQALGYQNDRKMEQVVDRPQAIMDSISHIPGITGITTRSYAFAMASSPSRTRGIMVMGIDPGSEGRVTTLPTQIREGKYLGQDEPGGCLMGTLLSRMLRAGIGDEITLLGMGRDGSVAATVVTVSGIYSSGIEEIDRNVIRIPIKHFDDIFSMDSSVHAVVIAADDLANLRSTAAMIKKCLGKNKDFRDLTVLDWGELTPGLMQSIKLDLFSGFLMYTALVLVVAFSITNTFIMAIFERNKEFGVIMAMGARPGRIVRMLLAEAFILNFLGIFSGMAAGAFVTLFFQSRGIDMGEAGRIAEQYGLSTIFYPRLGLISLLTGPAMVMVITFFSAFIPALKIWRMTPSEALNSV